MLGQKFKAKGWTVYGSVRSKSKDEKFLGEVCSWVLIIVCTHSTDQLQLAAIAEEIFEIDITDESSIQAAAQDYGPKALDILVNCAGS
jgi:NAD(P)-dependent dehydrogenase (short-subunit alcohol dehydrogenase family)